MKIRNGFVSNSSSSSFMVGIGVVTDWTKFNSWKNSVDYKYSIRLYSGNSKENGKYSDLNYNSSNGYSVDASTNVPITVYLSEKDYNSIKNTLPKEKIAKNLLAGQSKKDIVVYSISNDEGDSAFSGADDWDLDYDIDFCWFDKKQQEEYNGFGEENGISFVDKTFGAGRNG